MRLRIALAQVRCEKGAWRHNLASTLAILREADDLGVDILGLPEASLTGYITRARHPDAAQSLQGDAVLGLLAGSRGIATTCLPGLVEDQVSGAPYLTQLAIRDGELIGAYRKRTIPEDERDDYAAGDASPLFVHDGIPYGIAICADLGNEEVFADAARQGARIVFELAAPGLHGEQATRNWQSGFEWWRGECRKHLPGYCRRHGIWVAVATQAGRTVDEDFPGGGYLLDPAGACRYATADWSPGVTTLDLNLDDGNVSVVAET